MNDSHFHSLCERFEDDPDALLSGAIQSLATEAIGRLSDATATLTQLGYHDTTRLFVSLNLTQQQFDVYTNALARLRSNTTGPYSAEADLTAILTNWMARVSSPLLPPIETVIQHTEARG